MHTLARRSAALTISAILGLCVAAVVRGQAPPAGNGAAPAVPAVTATSPATGPTSRPGVDPTKTMQFNFVNAQISVILNEMASRFGFIIVQPATPVPGFITIDVPGPVNADEAVRLLNNILVPLGYSTLETYTTPTPGVQGSQHTILRIATLQEVKKSQIPVFEENNPDKIPVTDNLVTYVIPLTSVDAVRLRNDLTPLLSADADVAANPGANSLIVTDTSAKIHRLVEIVEKLDHQPLAKTEMENVQLVRANAADVATLINAMFNPTNTGQGTGGGGGGGAVGAGGGGIQIGGAGGRGGRGGGGGGGGGGGSGLAPQLGGRVYANSDARTNMLILNGPPEAVAAAKKLALDLEANDADVLNTGVFFIYSLKNAQAASLESVLNAIYGNSTTGGARAGTTARGGTTGTGARGGTNTGLGGGGTSGRGGTTGGRGGATGGRSGATGSGGLGTTGGGGLGTTTGSRTGTTAAVGTRAGGVGGTAGRGGAGSAIAGAAYFVANPDTNSLLVTTDKSYEQQVKDILTILDRPVPQVLIKVLIAEVTHTNGDDIGFEFGATDLRANGNGLQAGSDFGLSQATGGLKIGLVEGQVSATLRALANQNKLDVISRPYILVQDNQEAYMLVGQSVPYITNSQITNDGNTINTVTYRDVGVVLDVIPHINPDGLVTMDIAPQVSQLDPGSGVPISSNVFAPTFTIRTAQSRVAIKNNETIVIGGLMQDQNSQIVQKIPVLGDIPYLGMAFKRTINSKIKTELLIFLTPHVAMTPDLLLDMSKDEREGLKLVPTAVQPGTWEQQVIGMERGATTIPASQDLRIEGNVSPAQTLPPAPGAVPGAAPGAAPGGPRGGGGGGRGGRGGGQ